MELDTPDLDEMQRAADGGDAGALYAQAMGLVRAQRPEDAFPLYLRAAQAGHADAQVECARMQLYGVGCDADPTTAVVWLQRAESAGSVAAACYLAVVAVGNTVLARDADIDRRVGAAAQAGYQQALRAAAIHFGRKRDAGDQTLCLELLDRAAAQGDAIAAMLLAERMQRGEGAAADTRVAAALTQQLQAAGIPALPAVTAGYPQQRASTARTLELSEALHVPETEWLSEHPRVGVIDGLLSADECRLLIAAATPSLRASQTVDPFTGLAVAQPVRTSSDASIDCIREDLALRLVQLRIARAADMELVNAEALTVLRYTPGQQYRPHRDYVPPGTIERDRPLAGNRARTICVFLNDVEAGGETDFPVPGVRVSPQAGRAVVFDNLHANGQPDPDSLHAGLPVVRGEKWLATLWLRQRPYRIY